MMHAAPLDQLRMGFFRVLRRLDEFFLSDTVRSSSAQVIGHTRMALLACYAFVVSSLGFFVLQAPNWPVGPIVAAKSVSATLGVLPFIVRRREAITYLGHFVCAAMLLYVLAGTVVAGGRATGVAVALPLVPMVALVTRGNRAAIGWGLGAFAVVLVGSALLISGTPPLPGFVELDHLRIYQVSAFCIFGMLLVTFVFESMWNRTAIETANRAQADLVAREQYYRSLLENASEGVVVTDRIGRLTYASSAAERLVDLNPGEAIGKILGLFAEPDQLPHILTFWEEILETPNAVRRSRFRSKIPSDIDGETKLIEVTLENCLDNPSVGGVVGHLHDITELARAEASHEMLVDQSLQCISVECDDQIVYANQAMSDLLGVSREAIVDSSPREWVEKIHPDDRRVFVGLFTRTKPLELIELRALGPDDEFRWIQLRWTDFRWRGRDAHQVIFTDIHAQKMLEAHRELEHDRLEERMRERTLELEESQQTLRKQERLAAVGTLAAGIAHQINNPIGAILASADFALITRDDPAHEETSIEALTDIKAQAIRCGKIVRSVLQFSRSDPADKWSGAVGEVLRAALNETRRFAAKKGITVELDLSNEARERGLFMNPIELEQVFVNLIRNAIESAPQAGRVRICASVRDTEVVVAVEDDGPGVKAEHQDQVFDPFFTTRLSDGGTGLGLAVAHGIVEDHGGRMWIDRNPTSGQVGARFLVSLPVEKSEQLES